MSILSVNNTIGLLKDAIAGSGMAHEALASNIVNGQTPNYHRVDVDFKEALAAASGDPATSEELTLSTDNPGQIGASNPGDFSPSTTTDETSKMRADGNNVDLDQEMAKLSMNSDYGQTTTQFLRNQYAMFREVIEE